MDTLAPLSKIICPYIYRVYFWNLYSVLLIYYVSLLMQLSHCLDYCSFIVSLEIR